VILRGSTARLARNTVVRDITLQPGSRLLARNTMLRFVATWSPSTAPTCPWRIP